jgi:hypothetical protein
MAVDIPDTRKNCQDDGFVGSLPQGSPPNRVVHFLGSLLGRQRSDGQLREGFDPSPFLADFTTPPGSELNSPAPSPRLTLQELVQAGDAMRAAGQLKPLPTPGSPTTSRRESLSRQDSYSAPPKVGKAKPDTTGYVLSVSGIGF